MGVAHARLRGRRKYARSYGGAATGVTARFAGLDTGAAIASETGEPDLVGSDRRWPNLRPRPAATLMILDRGGAEPQVLMGRRHWRHAFMPGKFVFPGGRIEAADRRMMVANGLAEAIEAKLAKGVVRPGLSRPRALALAAIRETFEETGLLIGTKASGIPGKIPPGIWTEFVGHGVVPSLEGLHFVARAITPPRRPRRFDAAFFAVDANSIAHRIEGVIGPEAELVELAWLPLSQAKRLDLPTITRVVLEELEARIAQGMEHELPVPFFAERHRRWYRTEL
ncbi:MAG: NUDIX domain-containing protein [Methylobacteriaceae bacterium]|nr:NUDIX domain-containing protein [Methylobacteriaceae bacterium]